MKRITYLVYNISDYKLIHKSEFYNSKICNLCKNKKYNWINVTFAKTWDILKKINEVNNKLYFV
jgi:hypothetical protein